MHERLYAQFIGRKQQLCGNPNINQGIGNVLHNSVAFLTYGIINNKLQAAMQRFPAFPERQWQTCYKLRTNGARMESRFSCTPRILELSADYGSANRYWFEHGIRCSH